MSTSSKHASNRADFSQQSTGRGLADGHGCYDGSHGNPSRLLSRHRTARGFDRQTVFVRSPRDHKVNQIKQFTKQSDCGLMTRDQSLPTVVFFPLSKHSQVEHNAYPHGAAGWKVGLFTVELTEKEHLKAFYSMLRRLKRR